MTSRVNPRLPHRAVGQATGVVKLVTGDPFHPQVELETVPAKKTDRMERSRFSEEQIIAILKQQESGVAAADVCREHGFSSAKF